MPTRHDNPALVDPELPELELLVGPDGPELLAAALASADGVPEKVEIAQVRYVPSKKVTVQYRVVVAWADGRTTRETYVASAGLDVPAEVPIIEGDDTRVALWRFPDDPFLPGLATAANASRVQRLLSQLGVDADGVRVRTRAYRPGRRAVVEVKAPTARVFIKVVRPSRVAALQRIHASMKDAIHIPQSLGWSADDGLVVLQAMPGKTLRKALESRTKRLPGAGQLAAILDVIPADSTKPVAGARVRAPEHARLLSAILPEERSRVEAIVHALDGSEDGPQSPVHGDFHASQVLVRGETILGLIDVDTVGMGQRSHDYGNFLGHLATVGLISHARKNIHQYGASLLEMFDQEVDPSRLRLDVAGAIFGLATGPFRVFERQWQAQTSRRLRLAEEWVASAANTT